MTTSLGLLGIFFLQSILFSLAETACGRPKWFGNDFTGY